MKLPVVIRNEEVKVKEDKNGMPVGPWVSLLVHVCVCWSVPVPVSVSVSVGPCLCLLVHVCVCWSVPVSVRVSKQSLLNILNYVLK